MASEVHSKIFSVDVKQGQGTAAVQEPWPNPESLENSRAVLAGAAAREPGAASAADRLGGVWRRWTLPVCWETADACADGWSVLKFHHTFPSSSFDFDASSNQ